LKDGELKWTVQIAGIDARTKQLVNVTITEYEHGRPILLVYASRAIWLYGQNFTLENADVYHLQEFSYLRVPHLSTTSDPIAGSIQHTPTELELLQKDPTTLDFQQLMAQIRRFKETYGARSPDVLDAEVGLWSKLAFPLSSIVFAAVGAPLGLQKQRRSSRVGQVLSFLIVLVYYIIYMGMSSLAHGGLCSPALAAFTPDILCLIAGIYLTWKAST